jgi:hypothetical protein
MGLFDIFKKQEDIYYRDFKKMVYNLNKDEKITISMLRTRVMTIEYTIKSISEGDDEKLNDYELNDRNLKVAVLQKLLNEFKQDFIDFVHIKLKEIGENNIPLTYDKCNQFCLKIESNHRDKGRHIALEEIKYFKS